MACKGPYVSFYHNGPTPNLVLLTLSTYTLTGFFSKTPILCGLSNQPSTDASQELFDRCSSKDKEIQILPGAWHNLLHGEEEQDCVAHVEHILDWIEKRAK
jgi:hypothetical protein